ncbi:YdcF family protein [Chitinophaga sp. 30R24]|uniref:YdcF family protein n=1 Tax=Chitinophaga sp. 30R24 TaxID=3248838 RepID=UPI003B91EC80
MNYLKTCLLTGILFFAVITVTPGQAGWPASHYQFMKSSSRLQDRNFYFFTLMEDLPEIKEIVANDSMLKRLQNAYQQAGSIKSLQFSAGTISQASKALLRIKQHYPAPVGRLLQEMRNSGLFQLYTAKQDDSLLVHAWIDAANGVNYIINAYTTGTGMRYPTIDAAIYDVNSVAYNEMVQHLFGKLPRNGLFFQPSLSLALGLLELNHRDEAARYEPLPAPNAAPYKKVKGTDWERYPYSTLLILGSSPVSTESLSEVGKGRCDTGAALYRKGLVPFIIVSGGHVRPVGTQFSEAVEMKKYLVNVLKIPAAAVMVDPYARHTTTNVRNAVRIAWRSGIPVTKRMLCVSDPMHLMYVLSPLFKQRCIAELGYVPAADIKQTQPSFISFLPDACSLQADARDPLDP